MKEEPEEKRARNLLEVIDRKIGEPAETLLQKKYLTYQKEPVQSFTMTYNMIQKLCGGIVDTLAPGASGWSLVYSSELHGYSLNTLVSNAMKGPRRGCFILSVLEDVCTQSEYERVFGVVFFEPLRYENGSYGTSDTSLFRFRTPRGQDMSTCPNAILNIYNARLIENRRMYIITKKNYLAFGCGNGKFGLLLEKTLLQGQSNEVETFDNEVLSHREKFSVSRIELWHVRA